MLVRLIYRKEVPRSSYLRTSAKRLTLDQSYIIDIDNKIAKDKNKQRYYRPLGVNDMREKHIACECLECALINVVQSGWVDGASCIECGSQIRPIGYAIICNRPSNKVTSSIKIDVEVDTRELDKALEKVRELCRMKSRYRMM